MRSWLTGDEATGGASRLSATIPRQLRPCMASTGKRRPAESAIANDRYDRVADLNSTLNEAAASHPFGKLFSVHFSRHDGHR